jgi:hypothetical protein
MGFLHPGKWQDRSYHRPHKAALNEVRECVQLASVLTREDEMIGGVLTPSLNKVLRLRDVDKTYDASEVCER